MICLRFYRNCGRRLNSAVKPIFFVVFPDFSASLGRRSVPEISTLLY